MGTNPFIMSFYRDSVTIRHDRKIDTITVYIEEVFTTILWSLYQLIPKAFVVLVMLHLLFLWITTSFVLLSSLLPFVRHFDSTKVIVHFCFKIIFNDRQARAGSPQQSICICCSSCFNFLCLCLDWSMRNHNCNKCFFGFLHSITSVSSLIN